MTLVTCTRKTIDDNLVCDDDQLVFAIDHPLDNSTGIHNAFIASVPKHPLIRYAIDNIVHNITERSYGQNQYDITGPTALGKCVNAWLMRPKDTPFTKGYVDHDGHRIKFLDYAPGHVHNSGTPKNIMDLHGNVGIITKFPNYYSVMYFDRNTLHYDELYRRGEVYKEK